MHQQAVRADVVDVVKGDFEIVNGFRTGARGDGRQTPDLTVNRHDLFVQLQLTRRNKIVFSRVISETVLVLGIEWLGVLGDWREPTRPRR